MMFDCSKSCHFMWHMSDVQNYLSDAFNPMCELREVFVKSITLVITLHRYAEFSVRESLSNSKHCNHEWTYWTARYYEAIRSYHAHLKVLGVTIELTCRPFFSHDFHCVFNMIFHRSSSLILWSGSDMTDECETFQSVIITKHLKKSKSLWQCYTRWFKYDRDWFVLIYTQISPGHIWITLY
jgi:hypothetical protein